MKNKISIVILLTFYLISSKTSAQFSKVEDGIISQDSLESLGISWVDFDNDDDEDLFITTSYYSNKSRKDVLYENNGDGTFSKFTTGDLVNTEGTGRNTTWADYNNDGWIDVFVVNQQENYLYQNFGNGIFTKKEVIPTNTESTGSDHQGGAWGDFNGDGYVDLFLASYKLTDEAENVLYINHQDETFTPIPNSVVTTNGSSQDPTWIDFDNNGTLDLFVPNYCDENYLHINHDNESFVESTNNQLLISNCSTGSSWADYDNDGDFDVLIQNNVNQGNQFFENNGDGTFTQVNNELTSHSSNSASWGDYNNDGFIDLILVGNDEDRKTYLFQNNGDKSFTDVSENQGINNSNYSWGVASGDFNQDGFLDLYIANSHEDGYSPSDILYRNTPNENNWISITLIGTNSNSSAIGSVVRTKSNNSWQSRVVQSKTGHNSQSSLKVHFGFGQVDKIDTIVVEWPMKGFLQKLNTDPNQFLTLSEIDFPSAPYENSAEASGPFQVALSWSDTASLGSNFRLERSIDSIHFQLIASNIESNNYKDENLEGGFTYYYRVAKNIEGGYSWYSNISQQYIKTEQTINFEAISDKLLGTQSFELIAKSSSNLDVAFFIDEGEDYVTLNGNQVTIQDIGHVRIGAFTEGNDEYLDSDTIYQEFEILTPLSLNTSLIQIYPNPTKNYMCIVLPEKELRKSILTQIYSLDGSLIKSEYIGQHHNIINLSELKEGVYFVHINKQVFTILKE